MTHELKPKQWKVLAFDDKGNGNAGRMENSETGVAFQENHLAIYDKGTWDENDSRYPYPQVGVMWHGQIVYDDYRIFGVRGPSDCFLAVIMAPDYQGEPDTPKIIAGISYIDGECPLEESPPALLHQFLLGLPTSAGIYLPAPLLRAVAAMVLKSKRSDP